MEYRELTPEEMDKVPGLPWPPPKFFVGVGAVDEHGEVVACCGISTPIQLDPLWVREDHRGSPVILRRLWDKTRQVLLQYGAGPVLVGLIDSDPGPEREAVVAHAVRYAGGYEIKARVFVIPLDGGGVHNIARKEG